MGLLFFKLELNGDIGIALFIPEWHCLQAADSNLFFFKSGRVDIETISGVVIKLPINQFEESFKLVIKILNDDQFKIIIPLENSLAGRVADIHYLLPKYKLQIYAEHFQEIKHNLMILKDNNHFTN